MINVIDFNFKSNKLTLTEVFFKYNVYSVYIHIYIFIIIFLIYKQYENK